MARAAVVAAGAIFLAAGGAALGYALTRSPIPGDSPAWRDGLTDHLALVGKELAGERKLARDRATELAKNGRVGIAIDTSEQTIVDLFEHGELARGDTEIIEIGRGADKAQVAVATLPRGARHFTSTDRELEATTGTYYVTASVDISGDAGARGYVTVTRRFALAGIAQRLSDAGIVGRMVLGNGSIAIGAVPAGARTALIEQGEATFQVVVPADRGGVPMPIAIGGAAGAALGLLLVVIGMLRKPAATTAIARADARHGATRASGQIAVAAGTPPVDGGANAAGSGVAITPSQLGPGAMLGRWEIVRRIGSGGMADVHLARARGEAGFEKMVALKVMHAHLARNERAVAHFLDEARLAARVVHPNVVAIQDLGKIGDDYVIVMEFVDGVDLERLLGSARTAERLVPVHIGLGILCRICDGLNAAHTATAPDGSPLGIIHRDVKSANVLVSRQGGVKVVDFGIAKAAQQSHLTFAGETKGTPSMMAPEQRVGEQVDVRADVYAVAAVGYEILTGQGVNLDLAALAHLGVDNWPHLPPPSTLRADLPPELDELLLGAMAFERERRPADCAALEDRFATIMKKHGHSASDKDIARWAAGEIEMLVPPLATPTRAPSKPADAS